MRRREGASVGDAVDEPGRPGQKVRSEKGEDEMEGRGGRGRKGDATCTRARRRKAAGGVKLASEAERRGKRGLSLDDADELEVIFGLMRR